MKQFNIYLLRHPLTREVRYVGETTQTLKKRFSAHITRAKTSGKKQQSSCWIKSLLDQGLLPVIELIEICDESVWEEREDYWISYYPNLTNHNRGGRNPGGFPLSNSHKKAIKDSLKGRIRPDDVKLKISNSHKGKVVSQVTKDKLRNINLGKIQTLEQRLKTSAGGILQINPITNKVIKEYLTLGDIIKENPQMYKENIASACNGRLKTYHKFIWKYKKDMV